LPIQKLIHWPNPMQNHSLNQMLKDLKTLIR
jgi:hypothetical protein